MKIGVIGAGNVGGTLGRAWGHAGHDVWFGVQNPQDARTTTRLEEIGAETRAGSVRDVAERSEVVVFAVPWRSVPAAARSAGDLSAKVILDCTNPLQEDLSGLTIGHPISGAEQLAAWTLCDRVVKIFNTTGFENMATPEYDGTPLSMLYAGDDESAKRTGARLAVDIGFDPVDAGPLANARYLEAMAFLWIDMAISRGRGTGFAYQILTR